MPCRVILTVINLYPPTSLILQLVYTTFIGMSEPCPNSTDQQDDLEVLEITSSPSEGGDLSILSVSVASPREPTVIYEAELEGLADDEVVEVSTSISDGAIFSRLADPSETATVDDVEITNVEYHPGQTQTRHRLLLPQALLSNFFFPSDPDGTASDSGRLFPRSFSAMANPRRRRHTHIHRTRRANPRELPARLGSFYQSLFEMISLDALQANASGSHGIPSFSDQEQLNRALNLSAEQYEAAFATRQTPPAKSLDLPKETRPGYTRAIDPSNVYQCAWCELELNEGIPAKTESNTEFWDSKFRGATEADQELSKRVFFSPCSHIYCGWCVKKIINRPKGKKSKKATAKEKGIIASCCVVDCKRAFRGKFIEIFC